MVLAILLFAGMGIRQSIVGACELSLRHSTSTWKIDALSVYRVGNAEMALGP